MVLDRKYVESAALLESMQDGIQEQMAGRLLPFRKLKQPTLCQNRTTRAANGQEDTQPEDNRGLLTKRSSHPPISTRHVHNTKAKIQPSTPFSLAGPRL